MARERERKKERERSGERERKVSGQAVELERVGGQEEGGFKPETRRRRERYAVRERVCARL